MNEKLYPYHNFEIIINKKTEKANNFPNSINNINLISTFKEKNVKK